MLSDYKLHFLRNRGLYFDSWAHLFIQKFALAEYFKF